MFSLYLRTAATDGELSVWRFNGRSLKGFKTLVARLITRMRVHVTPALAVMTSSKVLIPFMNHNLTKQHRNLPVLLQKPS